MDIGDILGPWILLIMLVLPLLYVEKFIHQHIYGVGYLITKDKEQATTFYYLIFFPGVVLHEIIQYFMAGILNVPVKKLEPRPQKQDNGTLRFDFVTIQKTDKWRAAVIGGAPFLVACAIMWTISTSILDLHLIPEAFATGEISEIARTINDLRNTPDFWLWMYLLFTISNGMIPTKEDRQGWSFILVAIGAVSLFFIVLGLDNVVVETYQGPVMHGLAMVNTALAILLFIDIFAVLLLGVIEDTFERIRGEKMDYSGQKPKNIKRQAGSDLPIPVGEPMPSIYNLALPIPTLPPMGKIVRPSTVPTQSASREETKPAGVPTPPARQPAKPTQDKPQPTRPRQPAPALASNEPTLERVLDPDADLRAQMDPRVPRTSGDSPFKRSNLPQEEAKPATQAIPPPARQSDPARSAPTPRRSASTRPETKSEPTKEPTVPVSGTGQRFGRPSDAEKVQPEATQSMSTTQRIQPDRQETSTPSGRFGRKSDEDAKVPESSPASASRFQRKSDEEKAAEPTTSKPASRFGRKSDKDAKAPESSPASASRFQRKPDEEKAAEPTASQPASRFGRKSDKDAKAPDDSERTPARPTGRFSRPAPRTSEPTQTMQTTGSFRPNAPDDADTADVEESTDTLKPAKPSGRFSRPRRERERPTTPPSARFGRRSRGSSLDDETPPDDDDDDGDDDVEYVDFDDI